MKTSPVTRSRVNRVETGFPKLDEMLEGGLPQKTITLLSGACGTGKSTFAMQFLYHGAKYCNEPGVYVTLEETPESLVNNMTLFGWDLDALIKQKKIVVLKPEMYKFESLKQIISDAIDRIGAKRLVVDSYSVLLTYFSDPYQIRNGLVQLDREIKKMGCTALVISDTTDNATIFSTTGVEEFIVDGVIVVSLIKDPQQPYFWQRAVEVRKMRATHHPLSFYRFDITPKGIEIGGVLKGAAPAAEEARKKPGRRKKARLKKLKAPRRKAAANAKAQAVKSETPSVQGSDKIDISSLRARGQHSWKWKHL